MRKLIVSEVVSLDGVMEAPGGEEGYRHTGWTIDFHDPGMLAYKLVRCWLPKLSFSAASPTKASPQPGRAAATKPASPTR